MDIYVGNLPWAVTDDDLKEYFEQHGTVASARVITDRDTGRSRGFGFVTMPDDTEAKAAIEAADGVDFMGRPLRVNESKPRPQRDDRGGGDRGGSRW